MKEEKKETVEGMRGEKESHAKRTKTMRGREWKKKPDGRREKDGKMKERLGKVRMTQRRHVEKRKRRRKWESKYRDQAERRGRGKVRQECRDEESGNRRKT